MSRFHDFRFLKIQPFYRDGEGEGGEGEGEGESGEGNHPVTPTPTPSKSTDDNSGNKLFTQEELNAHLAKERRKLQTNNEKTIRELEALKKTAQLTEDEKTTLEKRINDLRDEYLTKEQLEKKKRKEEEDRIKKEKEELTKEREHWKNLYETSTIERELVDAAVKGDAYNPEQILKILTSQTRLVEELDHENKPTGRFVPKVRLAGKDKETGKTLILDLTPTDAVKQMKEMPEIYGNLFKSGARSGVGGLNVPGHRGTETGPPVGQGQAAYLRWREQRKKIGTRA